MLEAMRQVELSPSERSDASQQSSADHRLNSQRPPKRMRPEQDLVERELALFGYDHGLAPPVEPGSEADQSAEEELERLVCALLISSICYRQIH